MGLPHQASSRAIATSWRVTRAAEPSLLRSEKDMWSFEAKCAGWDFQVAHSSLVAQPANARSAPPASRILERLLAMYVPSVRKISSSMLLGETGTGQILRTRGARGRARNATPSGPHAAGGRGRLNGTRRSNEPAGGASRRWTH